MSATTWRKRLLVVTGIALSLCLTGATRADEKGAKYSSKGSVEKNPVLVQIDYRLGGALEAIEQLQGIPGLRIVSGGYRREWMEIGYVGTSSCSRSACRGWALPASRPALRL